MTTSNVIASIKAPGEIIFTWPETPPALLDLSSASTGNTWSPTPDEKENDTEAGNPNSSLAEFISADDERDDSSNEYSLDMPDSHEDTNDTTGNIHWKKKMITNFNLEAGNDQHGGNISVDESLHEHQPDPVSNSVNSPRSKRPIEEGSSSNKKRYVDEEESLPESPSLSRTSPPNLEPELMFDAISKHELPFNRNFHRRQWESTFTLRHNLSSFADLPLISNRIDDFYEIFMSEFLNEAMPTDRITVSINHHSINPPIYINFLRKDFKRDDFSDRLKAVAQSNRNLLEDGEIAISVRLVKDIGGQGRRNVAPKTADQRSADKLSVIQLKNTDNLCGLRAIMLGKLMVDEYDTVEKRKATLWHTKKRSVHTGYFFRDKALAVCYAVGLDPLSTLRISDLPKVQQHLGDEYRIVVVDRYTYSKVFCSPPAPKLICLELIPDVQKEDTGHYNLITKLAAYFDRYYMCIDCWFPSNNTDHCCPNGCSQCRSNPACSKPIYPDKSIECKDCYRTFFSSTCLANHKQNGTCSDKKKCKKCRVEYTCFDKHKCFTYHCKRCNKDYTFTPHYCYLSPLKEEDLKMQDMMPKAFVFYDIESTQKMMDGRMMHFPNLIICETVCDSCYDFTKKDRVRDCGMCGEFRKILQGTGCVIDFVDYILNDLAKRVAMHNGHVFVIAHNSKGYDAHFIFRDLFSRNLVDIHPILNGNKIMKIDLNNVRFLDSMSFFPQPLEALPKAFGLDSSLVAKGYFPHLFNTEENQNYIGKLPGACYFSPQLMKKEKRESFLAWYEENKMSDWILRDELIKYCANDVLILRICVMEYRMLVKRLMGLDPLTRCFTLASVAMEIFRTKTLPESFMAITPPRGYSGRHNSIEGCAWLDTIEITRHLKLRREWRVGPYFLDGYLHETGEAFEFNGCFYHGCPSCFPDPTMINNVSKKCMGELFESTQEKEEYLTGLGFKVVSFWSHDIKTMSDRFKNVFLERKDYYRKLQKYGPVSIREAFFGGRTNNISFLHDCAPDEQIRYVDFTSLYPSLLRKKCFPYGHPKVIRRNFDYTLDSHFGFVKCIILPPKDLFIPSLPIRSNNKLVFPLCSKCSEVQQNSKCEHSDSERSMVGTWATCELKLALKKGYKIIEIIEVLDYEKSPNNIFKKFVDPLLKEKQTNSGWPTWVKTEEDKEKYIRDYFEKEGIQLEKEAIKLNVGLRNLIKFIVNSLWGKFGLKPNQTKTTLVKNYADLWAYLNDCKLQIQSEYNPTDDSVLLQYKYACDEDDEDFAIRNLAVAAMVTAYGRVKLYKLIDEIESVRQGRVLYFDTDSVIFVEKSSDPKVRLGEFLGELTDELAGFGAGAECRRFVSLGPKNYGFEVHLPDGTKQVTIKTKGIRLSAEALEIVNFQRMMEMVNRYSKGEEYNLNIPQFRIRSTAASHIVYSETIDKMYRVVSDKRRVDGLSTLPYGYCSR